MTGPTTKRWGGEGCVLTADGRLTAHRLHEQLVQGVDDSDIRSRTREKLLARGLLPEQVDRLFPDLPPSKAPPNPRK
jgi:hypothetical protein